MTRSATLRLQNRHFVSFQARMRFTKEWVRFWKCADDALRSLFWLFEAPAVQFALSDALTNTKKHLPVYLHDIFWQLKISLCINGFFTFGYFAKYPYVSMLFSIFATFLLLIYHIFFIFAFLRPSLYLALFLFVFSNAILYFLYLILPTIDKPIVGIFPYLSMLFKYSLYILYFSVIYSAFVWIWLCMLVCAIIP